MNLEQLITKIVSIPSYLDDSTNESKLADFLIDYISVNLPWLEVIKQQVERDRYNVIARSTDDPKLLFISHMDTVLPVGNSQTRLTPQKKEDKLYGLGVVDMKAGLAASIKAAEEIGEDSNVALLFDCGEEYYFKGINKFIQVVQNRELEFTNNWKPDLVVFPEPSNLKISNGCRGLLEIEFIVKGKTCHAGRPEKGVNAIETSVRIVEELKQIIQKGDVSELGNTTVNLAGMSGGLLQDGKVVVRPNAVADMTKFVLDIRSANPELSGKKVCAMVKQLSSKFNANTLECDIRIDYPPYLISQQTKSFGLRKLEEVLASTLGKVEYKDDIAKSGYGEIALIGGKLGWDSVNLGPGPSDKAHQVDEYVDLSTVEKCLGIYSNLILKFKNYEK